MGFNWRAYRTGKAWFLMLTMILLTASCKQVEYIPVEKVCTKEIVRNDTVHERDSVVIEKNTVIREADDKTLENLGIKLNENEKAILILQELLQQQKSGKERIVYRDSIIHDSVPKIVYVEKKTKQNGLKKWPLILGIGFLLLAFGYRIFLLAKEFWKL